MIAVDTNVLVRVITNDDSTQASVAARLLNRNQVFISKTVLLETEWVLRSAYRFELPAILNALSQFLNRQNVEIEDEGAVRRALDWCEQGMDFADAVHLASAAGKGSFFTFDAGLIRKAKQLGLKVTGLA